MEIAYSMLQSYPESFYQQIRRSNYRSFVKVFKENRLNLFGLLVLGFMLARWLRDRRSRFVIGRGHLIKKLSRVLLPVIRLYAPTFWLPGPHIKELVRTNFRIPYLDNFDRVNISLSDKEVIALDFYPACHEKMAPQIPTVLVVPEEFSDSKNVNSQDFCSNLWDALGWRSCVLNRRGYGGMPYTVY